MKRHASLQNEKRCQHKKKQLWKNIFQSLMTKLYMQVYSLFNDKKRVHDGKRDSRGYVEAAVIDPPCHP